MVSKNLGVDEIILGEQVGWEEQTSGERQCVKGCRVGVPRKGSKQSRLRGQKERRKTTKDVTEYKDAASRGDLISWSAAAAAGSSVVFIALGNVKVSGDLGWTILTE